MKGMKKLFALLAVLTMALTLTPMVAPVAAADQQDLEITLNTTSTTLYKTATTQLKVEKVELVVGEVKQSLKTASVDFEWNSLNEGVATVSHTGSVVTVTGVATGTAMIQVTASYTVGTVRHIGITYCTVVVKGDVIEIELSETGTITLYTEEPNKSKGITATVLYKGEKADEPTVSWEVDPAGIVKFSSSDGLQTTITASTASATTGTIVFTATVDNYTASATLPLEIKEHTFDVSIVPTTTVILAIGQKATLRSVVKLDGEEKQASSYEWTVEDEDVLDIGTATTQPSLTITGLKAGTTTVTLKAGYKVPGKTYPYTGTATVAVQVKSTAPTTFTGVKSNWSTIGGVTYYVVDYSLVNAQNSNASVALTHNGSVLAEALPGSTVAVPFAQLWNKLENKDGILTLEYREGGMTVATAEVYVKFFKVDINLADSYKSGDYVTGFKITVTRQDGAAFEKSDIPAFVITDGKNTLFTIPSASLTLSTDKKKASAEFKDLEIRFTGGEDYEWYVIQNVSGNYKYAEDLAYKTIAIEQTTFKFSPAYVTVTGTPTFTAKVYLTDANGEPVVKDTVLQVKYYYSDTASGTKAATVKLDEKQKSYFEITLPTPPKAGTYTATVTTKDPTWNQVDGKGTFTISLPGEIHMTDPALFTSTIGESVITVFAGEGKEDISKLWVTIDNPNGVVKKYVVDSASKVLVYKDGVYCEAPDPIDIYWTNINSSQANIKLNLVQGGSFKVTVKAQLKDGSTFSETKEYTNKMYRIESSTLTPTVPVYGKEAKMTLVVKDWAGDSVNNATITVDDRVVTPVEEVHGGKYVIDLGKALIDGLHTVKVYAGSTLMAKKDFEAVGADTLKVTLTPTTVVAGKKVEGTVKDADDKAVNGTAVVQIDALTKYDVSVVNGKFTIDTSDARFTEARAYTVRVVDSAKKNIGTAEFTITLPLTVVSPTDGLVNNGVADSIVVTVTSGLSPAKVALEPSVIYVVDKGKLSEVKSVSFKDSYKATVEDNKVTLDFVAGANPQITFAKLLLKYGNYTATAFKPSLPKLEIVQTATWYMGDTVPLKVKLTDAHGNPVAGITVTAQQLGYFNLTAKTGTDGIADFGDVYLNVAGNVVATVGLFGPAAGLEAKVAVLAARPTQALKVTVTPTIVDAGKDALLTLTLVGADDKPVETGKSVVVTIGPSTYSGLVGANGVVTLTVKAESLTGTVVTGVVKVEGYNAATFTLAVKEAEKPEVKTLIELAPGMDVYTVNGETKFWDATPYIKEGRTMVPIRHLAEALGFKADWDFSDPANKMVFIFKADQDPEKDKEHPFILLIIGQPTAMVNGNLVALDVAPEILNGRTMVPLRFVVETLGYKVEWLGNTVRLYK